MTRENKSTPEYLPIS